jgi:hypothetical protein
MYFSKIKEIPIHVNSSLMQSSRVNNKIKPFKRKLMKMVKVYQHTSVLEMDNDRKPSTNHSQCLNVQRNECFLI